MRKILAIVIAIMAIGFTVPAGATESTDYNGATSSLQCGTNDSVDGTYRFQRCELSNVSGDFSQVVASDSVYDVWFHAEWDRDVAHCNVWEDLSGHCYWTDGAMFLYQLSADGFDATGNVPDYNAGLSLGMTGNFAVHIYWPTPEDPNLQFPLIMFYPTAW